jgi:hypothetical protein
MLKKLTTLDLIIQSILLVLGFLFLFFTLYLSLIVELFDPESMGTVNFTSVIVLVGSPYVWIGFLTLIYTAVANLLLLIVSMIVYRKAFFKRLYHTIFAFIYTATLLVITSVGAFGDPSVVDGEFQDRAPLAIMFLLLIFSNITYFILTLRLKKLD